MKRSALRRKVPLRRGKKPPILFPIGTKYKIPLPHDATKQEKFIVLRRTIKRVLKSKKEKGYGSVASLPSLQKRLDTVFSKWVRRAAADDDGLIHCFICGMMVHWIHAENMHFMGRNEFGTRFSEVGCQAGCYDCNRKPNGDRENFAKKLDEKFGAGTADQLRIDAKKSPRAGRNWYEERIQYYTTLFQALENGYK